MKRQQQIRYCPKCGAEEFIQKSEKNFSAINVILIFI